MEHIVPFLRTRVTYSNLKENIRINRINKKNPCVMKIHVMKGNYAMHVKKS